MAVREQRRVAEPSEQRPRSTADWLEGLTVVAVGALFAWGTWRLVRVPAPLGHDEAWYAVMGEALARGLGDVGLVSHRPAFYGQLSAPIHLISQSESALRLMTLPFGLATLAAGWWLGRRVGRIAGLLALVGLAATPMLYTGASFFLTDLPAAALLLVAVALLWYGFEERRSPSWTVAAAGACLAGAFYMRYGSVVPIGLVVVTALVVWRRQLRRHATAVVGGAAITGALLLPHLVVATVELGAPWRLVARSAGAVRAHGAGAGGLWTYVAMVPQRGPGLLLTAGLVIAAAGTAIAGLARRPRRADARRLRLLLLLVVPSVLHFVIIGWTAHAELRFLYPTVVFGVTAGGAAVGYTVSRAAAWRAELGWWVAVYAVLTPWLVAGGVEALRGYRDEVATRERFGQIHAPVKATGLEIARSEDPPDCLVLTSYNPQIQWYSGCPAVQLPPEPEEVLRHAADSDVLLVLFTGGKHQPEGPALDAYLAALEPDHAPVIDHGTGSPLEPVTIYRVPRQSPGAG
jgi:hypothetical protein